MPQTIDDFEDDGASFRVRRQRQLEEIYGRPAVERLVRSTVVIVEERPRLPLIGRIVLGTVGALTVLYLAYVVSIVALAVF